jgi:hypothetical protein
MSGEQKPIAYLVWMQARLAIDDVEDYYEVARPGDKSVDGSEPFPVYEHTQHEWQRIETYHAADKFVKVQHILCGHSENKWIRMGRYYPEMKRWYYSGTNERSHRAQVEGDEPTHWMMLPKPPEATTAPKPFTFADPARQVEHEKHRAHSRRDGE